MGQVSGTASGGLPPDVAAEIAPDEVDLRTERLLLRHWREADRAPFAEMCADPAVMRFFPSTLTREQSDGFVDRIRTHFAEHGYGLWVVQVGGAFAGFTGLQWSAVSGARALEVGWRLAAPFWGHGYATEAARAAIDVGLRQVPEVVSFTSVVNVRSERVMQRVGMRRVREYDHPLPGLPDHLRRHVLYATP